MARSAAEYPPLELSLRWQDPEPPSSSIATTAEEMSGGVVESAEGVGDDLGVINMELVEDPAAPKIEAGLNNQKEQNRGGEEIEVSPELSRSLEAMTLSTQNDGGATELSKDKSSNYTVMVPSAGAKVYEKMADAGSAVKPDSRREVVQKLDKVPVEVSIFLHLLESTKQERQHELYKARETGFLPRNNLISRGKDKEFVMQWLRKPSNEHSGIDLYRNISLLSVMGYGGMGKTTLLQHVYEDDMAEEFDLKMSMKDARQTFDRMSDRNIVDKLLERLMVDRVAYAKSCEFDCALRVFDERPYHDIAIWNVLISGYEQNERPKEALAAFNELQDANVEPNQLTLVVALSACSQLGAIEMNMYSKCGDLENALYVFRSVKNRNVFVWGSMIAGLAMHGRGKEALDSFKEMQEAKVKPSHVTFTNILSVCSHAVLVKEGRMYSSQMLPLYEIAPDIEHDGCMVDILGRAGRLEEAMDPRCKVFDPGGLIIIFTSISLSITRLDRVEPF